MVTIVSNSGERKRARRTAKAPMPRTVGLELSISDDELREASAQRRRQQLQGPVQWPLFVAP